MGLLANSGCLRNCPWQTFHDNLIAHSAEAEKLRAMPEFNPHLCWTMYSDEKNFPEFLKATWIRPEDIDLYAPYVDFIKLATRQHAFPKLVVGAYTARSYQGSVLDLMEPGFFPAFSAKGVYSLDNASFPDDWAQTVSHCSRECTECGYCEEVFEKVKRP